MSRLRWADLRHVECNATGRCAELRGVMRKLRHLRTPRLVLAGQAGDVGTGAADQAPIHYSGPPPRARQMLRQQLASLPAAEDQSVEPSPLEACAAPCTG